MKQLTGIGFRTLSASVFFLAIGLVGPDSLCVAENAAFKEVQVAADAFSLGDPVPSWVDPVAIPETTKTDPVVIRLADTQFYVGTNPVVYVRRAFRINDVASLTSAGQIPIRFVPQYQRLRLHSVRIIRGEEVLDRTRSSTIRFLQRELGLEQGIYIGVVTASVLVNDLRVGDTLECEYSVHGQNPVFGGKFFSDVSWDQSSPTELRRVTLTSPISRRINWKVRGDIQLKTLEPRESVHGEMRKLRFEERSITAINVDPYTPLDSTPYRWVQFSEFSSWREVVSWADSLFKVNAPVDKDLRRVIDKLKVRKTTEERVVAALEFVQSEIRYFSVSLGESSHRPTQPNIVLRQRYGDCKDKAFLLMTLLKELGIDSKPVLVRLGIRKDLDKNLPSPTNFDHAILQVRVDGMTYYLDPARLGQHGRLSRMGQAHEGAQVLVVGSQTRELVRISSPNVSDLSRSDRSEIATLPTVGPEGKLEVRQVWNGVGAEYMRVLFGRMSRDQIVKSMAATVERRYPGAKLVNEPQMQDDSIENTFTVTAHYNVPKLAEERPTSWIVRFNPINFAGVLVLPPSLYRISPVAIPGYPFEGRYSFEVRFPDDVSVITDPQTQSIRNKYFTFTNTSSFRGNLAKVTADLKALSDRVEVGDVSEYFEDVRKYDRTPAVVVLVKSEIKPAEPSGAKKKDFKQTLLDRLKETVEKTTLTIDSGKLTGSDLASAYCDRGTAYADMGKLDQALSDANFAINLSPNSTEILTCRAEVHFQAGEFQKSVNDYTKALSLGATDFNSFHRRGISKFYLGKMQDAAEDFLKASRTEDKRTHLYNDLWIALVHKRLGKSIPDVVVKGAAADPRGDWPRPALAVLSGKLKPEEMLNLLDHKSGDDLLMAQAEGSFYLGQYYLSVGNKAKARDLFEKVRQRGVVNFVEHAAAGFELRQFERKEPASPK